MKDAFEQLKTIYFTDYLKALEELRSALDQDQDLEGLNDGDLFYLLRPYCWFLHDPGFQDIYDICNEAVEVYQKYQKDLMEKSDELIGNEFVAVNTFLISYLDHERYDTSEWKILFASAEVATATTADKYAQKLKAIDKAAAESSLKLAALLRSIEGSKHVAYCCLRAMGDQCLGLLQTLIHKFPSDNQNYILHALDAFPGNQEVVDFYTDFIAQKRQEYLKEEAEKYLKQVLI